MPVLRASHDLAPDPVLVHRDRLTDEQFVADHLSTVLTGGRVRFTSVRRATVKYRWSDSLRVVYELGHAGGLARVAGRSFATSQRAADAAASAGRRPLARPAHPFRAVTLDAATDSVWFVAPADRRLPALNHLDIPPDHLSDLPSGRWVTTELVQYAPERSATFRAVGADGSTVAFAKLYRHPADAVDLAGFYRHAVDGVRCAGSAMRLPAPLGADAERGVLLLEPLPGVDWNRVDPARLARSAAAIGEGLAALHGLGRAGRRPFERLRADHVLRATQLIAQARPDLADPATALGRRLHATAPASSAPVLLHGDVHPKNVLVSGDGVSLIDLDQAGWGSAANDLAGMIARVRHGALSGQLTPAEAASIERAFLDGYSARRAVVPPSELRWFVAAALVVERALRAITRFHPDGLRLIADTLVAAADVLEDSLP